MESSVMTMLRYIKEGKIVVDPCKNQARHLPRLLQQRTQLRVLRGAARAAADGGTDFQEMYPNRAEGFCCTGGGGAMSMSEYTPRRLKSAEIKADQIRETGAEIVVTSCHNCVDGLADLIKHYELGCEVKQLVDLVADALVLEECWVENKPAEAAAAAEAVEAPPAAADGGRRSRSLPAHEPLRRTQDPRRRRRRGHPHLPRPPSSRTPAPRRSIDRPPTATSASRRRGSFKPDLISLDLSMPGQERRRRLCRAPQDRGNSSRSRSASSPVTPSSVR
jgi:hypothetical protein